MNIITPETYQHDMNENPRKRISKACFTCRQKKTKCDSNIRQPCSTCAQYGRACEFDKEAPRKCLKKSYIRDLESRLQQVEQLLNNTNQNNVRSIPTNINYTCSKRKREDTTSYHGSSSGYQVLGNLLTLSGSHESENNPRDKALVIVEKQNHMKNTFHITPILGKGTFRVKQINESKGDLMVFVDESAEEEIVEDKVDDYIPSSVVSGLINAYFSSELLLPIVDRDDYLDAFEGRKSPPPAILLTCAICTYACLLVKPGDPMFEKASVTYEDVHRILADLAIPLYERNSLVSCISTIQALVLYANYPPLMSNTNLNWIFAGMAVRMAQDLGLHRQVQASGADKSNLKRKRVWYSVYVTDRWYCTIMEKPLAISDFDCDVDMLLTDESKPDEDLTIFLNFIKLSKILGEVLRYMYSARAKKTGYKTHAIEKIVLNLQKVLDDWYSQVPETHKITEADLKNLATYKDLYGNTVKIRQGGPLTVCYHFVIILLHRPFVAMENVDTPFLVQCVERCIQAANFVTIVSQFINTKSFIHFGWNFACCSVYLTSLIHAFISFNDDPKLASEAKRFFHTTMHKTLKPMMNAAPNGFSMHSFIQNIPNVLEKGSTLKSDLEQQQNSVQLSEEHGPKPLKTSENSDWAFNCPEHLFLYDFYPNMGALSSENSSEVFKNDGNPEY